MGKGEGIANYFSSLILWRDIVVAKYPSHANAGAA